jgi:hypothetical protein
MHRHQIAVLAYVAFALSTSQLHARKWSDSTGRYSVEADLVRNGDEDVVLRKQNGSHVTVPLVKLSDADRQYVDSLRDNLAMQRERSSADRNTLIKALVARGDAAPEGAKHFAYQLVLRYAPDDEAVERKLVGPTRFSMSNAEIAQMQFAISNTSSEDFGGWPKSTTEMETVELRLLLDEKISGDLRFTTGSIRGMTARIMMSRPDRTIDEVLSKYGPPTSEKKRGDSRVLTYGRIRLIGNSAGKVICVLMSPR